VLLEEALGEELPEVFATFSQGEAVLVEMLPAFSQTSPLAVSDSTRSSSSTKSITVAKDS